MKKIMFFLMSMMAMTSFANITVQTYLTDVDTHDNSAVSIDTLFKIVVDIDGDGLDLAVNGGSISDFLNGSDDDIILGSGGFYGSGELWYDSGSIVLPSGAAQGDDYYVVFYEGLTSADTAPGESTWFGVYRDGTDELNWSLPSDGNTVYAESYGLATSDVSYYQTVPEPATALLALIGGGIAYAVRRRGHKFVC
ncbi:MAG: PEP-CTERM sorting domain-containing protein [Kiritimatiellales bacterium]